MITVIIDELTPCLTKVETGEIYETEVIKLTRKSFLARFNKRTGWYINWSRLPDEVEVYALVIKGSMEIQGLIALQNDKDAFATYIKWACAAPHNDKWKYGSQKYSGVGGHLFAIAARKSIEWGYGGAVHAEAIDKKLLEYYIEKYNAESLPFIHPYHFFINENEAQKIMEVYTYDWSDEVY